MHPSRLPPVLERPVDHSARRFAAPRLLVVARWPVGGIRTHLASNYPLVSQAGYRCTFVVPGDGSLLPLQEGLSQVARAGIVPVPVRGSSCSLWKSTRRLLRSEDYALVHAHGMTAAAQAALAGLGVGVPLVVTLHEPLRDDQFAGLTGVMKRWVLGRVLMRAAAIITVSEDSRDNLIRYFPVLRKRSGLVHLLPNGIDTTRYRQQVGYVAPTLREELSLKAGVRLVGFLGRFMPEKGFPLLLEAIRRLAGREGMPAFHVVAFGSGDYRREYQHKIETEEIGRLITLRDSVADVLPVMRQLDLVVVPSLWEASSLVSMEAMAAGVPVLGSDCPGLREVLRQTPSRVVPTGDADALAEGLFNALTEPRMEQARAFALIACNRFDNEGSARGLLELYAGLLRSRSGSDRAGH